MKAAEVKSLVAPQGTAHPYRVEAQGDITFFFPPSLWGATITSHELENRIIMVRTEGREGRFIVRVSPRIMDTARRNIGFHVTDGLNCWYVELRYNRHGEYLTHEVSLVVKEPRKLGLVRSTAIIRPEGTSREEQLSLRDYGSTVVVDGSVGQIFEKVTSGIEIALRCRYPSAIFTGPTTGSASRTILIRDTTNRLRVLRVHFNPFYERHELHE